MYDFASTEFDIGLSSEKQEPLGEQEPYSIPTELTEDSNKGRNPTYNVDSFATNMNKDKEKV